VGRSLKIGGYGPKSSTDGTDLSKILDGQTNILGE